MAALVIVGNVVFATLAGFSLARLKWRGQKKILGIILATLLLRGGANIGSQFVPVKSLGFADSVYGFDVTRDAVDSRVSTTLRLSLLRAPRFPDPHTDQGPQTHRFGMMIGTSLEQATRAGSQLNAPHRVLTGSRPVEPLVTVDGGAVLSCVKLADDRSGDLIVRIYEPAGRRGRARIRVSGPFALRGEVDPLEAGTMGVPTDEDGTVVVAVDAFQVRTFRFERK